ncbi:unnamed protein product [Symbiodinium sp. CCMP2592]|nr:unnamed protein product [Symbiodinium sp. CCMP2592]
MVQHRLSRNGPVSREIAATITRMDCGPEIPSVWNQLDRYVTSDRERVALEANDLADRLFNAQVGLAEAVYRCEWDEDSAPMLSILLLARVLVLAEAENVVTGISPMQNDPNACMIETSWVTMTKAERLFLTKRDWHERVGEGTAEWRLSLNLNAASFASKAIVRMPLIDPVCIRNAKPLFTPRRDVGVGNELHDEWLQIYRVATDGPHTGATGASPWCLTGPMRLMMMATWPPAMLRFQRRAASVHAIAQVASALEPGAEIVLRKNADEIALSRRLN